MADTYRYFSPSIFILFFFYQKSAFHDLDHKSLQVFWSSSFFFGEEQSIHFLAGVGGPVNLLYTLCATNR